ncbi:MAG: hypothetical protein R3D29_11790 [Nitratireductor sp.]
MSDISKETSSDRIAVTEIRKPKKNRAVSDTARMKMFRRFMPQWAMVAPHDAQT